MLYSWPTRKKSKQLICSVTNSAGFIGGYSIVGRELNVSSSRLSKVSRLFIIMLGNIFRSDLITLGKSESFIHAVERVP